MIFFQFLGISFCHCTILSGVKKYFQYISTGTCRSLIPRLREYEKAQFILHFLYVATFSLQKYTVQIFQIGLKKKPC